MPADAAMIAAFSRRTFYDTFAGFNTEADMKKFMDEQFAAKDLEEEASKNHRAFLLAFSDEELAGYAFLREAKQPAELNGADAIEIGRIYAGQSFIGKGIGRLLMENCLSIARSRNKQVIWLGVWEHNETAISFYKKWGFEKFSSHQFILGDDVQTDWLMKKTL